jgi:two-component system cell cycle sensor histidine kinase/response regulator CckA
VGASKRDEPGVVATAFDDTSLLRRVIEAVPAFVVLLDEQQRILYISRLQPGFKLEDVIGRPSEDFTTPETHAPQRAAIEAALQTGQMQTFPGKGLKPDGRMAHYETSAVPVVHGSERQVCLIAVDVTEHVERAEALRESEERLRLLVEATGIGLWSWDVVAGTSEWSARMREITGCEHALTPPLYAERIVHPDDRERAMASVAALASGGNDYFVHRIVRPDGSVRWVMPCVRTQHDDHGRLLRVMGGTLDVTAQHQVEEHLRNAQKIDAVGALTAGVAHNFNNMLAVIVPALDLVLRDARATQKKLLIDAAHAARRASELVAQLMTFAGQRREGERKVQDISPIVERAVSMCRRTFAAQLAIDFSASGVREPVRCDAAALEQVIVNLLINARDAMLLTRHDDPRVRVELTEVTAAAPGAQVGATRAYVRLSIRDHGIGMSRQVKERLFEPFFTTKEPGRGTGLGLATSYGIVRDHGGFIMFDSTEGVGTIAQVYLPVEVQPPLPQAATEALIGSEKHGAVLIVDDEAAVRGVVEEVLRLCGHDTQSAADPASVERYFASGALPDVILLDRSMPGFPVRTALALLRKHAPRAPILFFTGQDVPADERDLVDGILYKPLSLDELVDAVEKRITRT